MDLMRDKEPQGRREYLYRIHRDSDGDASLEMEFPGFYPTWAYATGDEENLFWEFDLASLDGWDAHIAIPYTLSPDVLETLFWRAIEEFKGRATS